MSESDGELGEGFGKPEAARIARALVHQAREAALGSLTKAGAPMASHVSVAALADGTAALLVSDLALHTANLKRDARASLLFVDREGDGSGDSNARGRLTLIGRVEPVPDDAIATARFVRRHRAAAAYIGFADMHLVRLVPERAHLVAGFGRITNVPADALLREEAAAAALAEIDDSACAHMDEDHADALAAIAGANPADAAGSAWQALGIDPLGIDVGASEGGRIVRAEFPEPVRGASELRHALAVLTKAARAALVRTS